MKRSTTVSVALSLLFVGNVMAAPDAGTLLQQQPQAPVVAPPPPAEEAPATPAPEEKDTGPKFLVKGFRIQGAVLIPEAELVAQLKGAIGREMSLRQLQRTATILVAYYAQKGYLARVVVPEQEIRDGIVTLRIVEGRRGNININSNGHRIDAGRVRLMIDERLAAGDVMSFDKLGEALNIINDQPGVAVTSALVPGKGEGDVNLNVTATEKPLLAYSLNANNYGYRSTGEAQGGASITLNNPTGHFDAASLLTNISNGTDFLRGDYSFAAGNSGLRLGVDASKMNYHVTQGSFSALNAAGSATTAGVVANYPLAARTRFNLNLNGGYDEYHLIDSTVSGTTSDRKVDFGSLGLSGYTVGTPENLLGSGMVSFAGNLFAGNVSQANAAALATDSTTRQVEGGYTKLGFAAGYLRPLASTWSFNGKLRGQFADKNLDSSQQFILGGPSGVRAYPVGEATGDEGWLVNLNLSDQFRSDMAASVFLDSGSIVLNRNLWNNWNAGSPGVPNRYMLSGAGAGLDWRVNPKCLVSASIATPLGNNPGSINGLNSDGSKVATRGWVSVTAQF